MTVQQQPHYSIILVMCFFRKCYLNPCSFNLVMRGGYPVMGGIKRQSYNLVRLVYLEG
jgi:hypothetical protein